MDHDYQNYLRLGLFFGVFAVIAVFEAVRPRRKPSFPRLGRWFSNFSFFFINFFMLRVVLGGASFAAAEFVSERGWGFLHEVDLTRPVEFAIGFVFLDFMGYLSHVLYHALPFLWRFHMPHHTDLDFDITTGTRFHPVEVLISMFYRIGIVAAMGIDQWTVLTFELVNAACVQFAHSNVKVSEGTDHALRKVMITPDYHRVHHSADPEEANSNFGFIFSWWDKLFGTYRAAPAMPHNVMQIGLEEYRTELSLWSLLVFPLAPRLGDYSFKKGD